MKSKISNSYQQTQQIGEEFGRHLAPGTLIALYGDLGAGKTTFVQGLAKGLGINKRIISPTFVLIREHGIMNHELKINKFYHVDLYRIESEKDIEGLGLEEILSDKNAIVAIEWADKLGAKLPKERVDIYFENLEGDKRKITMDHISIYHTNIDKAVEVFKNGGVVIFPTDTAFGIGCRIDDEKAVNRLFELRKRPKEQATPVLVSSLEMAREYVLEIPQEVEEKLIKKYWPGAVTIVLPAKTKKVLGLVRGGGNTIGIRMPNNQTILSIIKGVGVPILGPSANFHGEKTPYALEELDPELLKLVDYVVQGETSLVGKASTVIDCSVTPWRILREGAMKISI